MQSFPLKIIVPRVAIVSGEANHASIEILLRPFAWKDKQIDTSIRLDGISIPSVYLSDLAGKTFEFPVNDEESIDGSIYLDDRHHPVDVTQMRFVQSRDEGLKIIVSGTYIFEFEGLDDFQNTPFTFGVGCCSAAI